MHRIARRKARPKPVAPAAPVREIGPVRFNPEPGWKPVVIPMAHWHARSLVSGDMTNDRMRTAYFLREADRVVIAKVWFGPGAAGPPGHAHGGSIAAVLDELLGMGAWVLGHYVLVATLSVDYLRMIPLGVTATGEAWIDRVEDRKVFMKGRLFNSADETEFAHAHGMFLQMNPAQLEKLASLLPGPLVQPQ